jgi:NTE family protein
VEIDGEAYWDGGYAANPPLIPLARETSARDILVVQVTPAKSATTPLTSRAILKRLGRLTFNATLNAQIDALRLAAGLDETGRLAGLRVAHLAAEDEIANLAQRSAYDLGWDFLLHLRDGGRAAAQKWLDPGRPASVPV